MSATPFKFAECFAIPSLITFEGNTTNCPPDLQPVLEGTVAWHPDVLEEGESVTDKYGVVHTPKRLYSFELPTDEVGLENAFQQWMLDHHPTVELHRFASGVYVNPDAQLARSVWRHFTTLK